MNKVKEYNVGDKVWIKNRFSNKIEIATITKKQTNETQDGIDVSYFLDHHWSLHVRAEDLIESAFPDKADAIKREISNLEYRIRQYEKGLKESNNSIKARIQECEDEIRKYEEEIDELKSNSWAQ